MYSFGKKSQMLLDTCHQDIQKVMNEAIKHKDFSIAYGHRTKPEQFALFKQGRKFKNGKWVKVGPTVTDRDGNIKMSEHNYYPSHAIDILPYPFNGWKDLNQFMSLKEVIFEAAKTVGVKLVWGADWDSDGDIKEHSLQDYPHYQLA